MTRFSYGSLKGFTVLCSAAGVLFFALITIGDAYELYCRCELLKGRPLADPQRKGDAAVSLLFFVLCTAYIISQSRRSLRRVADIVADQESIASIPVVASWKRVVHWREVREIRIYAARGTARGQNHNVYCVQTAPGQQPWSAIVKHDGPIAVSDNIGDFAALRTIVNDAVRKYRITVLDCRESGREVPAASI
jgi:hypothetical protein